MATRQVTVVIGARDELSRVLDSVGLNLKELGTGFGAVTKYAAVLGAAIVAVGGALAAIAITTANAGDAFQKMALRTGVSVEALSELKYAAELSGLSIEDIETGLRKLSKTMFDAANGSSSAAKTFSMLGIDVKDVSGHLKAADDVFMEAVGALNSLSSETEKAALAQELFGKSGTMLLPLIKEGKIGIEALREEARKLGITFSDVEANQAAAFSDELDRVKAAVLGLKNVLGKELIPTFTIILEKITEFITTSEDFAWALDTIGAAAKRFISQFVDIRDPLEKLGALRDELGNLRILQLRLANEEANIMSQPTISRTLFYGGALERVQGHAGDVATKIKAMEEAIASAEQAYIQMNTAAAAGTDESSLDLFTAVDPAKLKAPEGANSLMAFVMGDLDVPSLTEKITLAGTELGKAYAASFAAGQQTAQDLGVGELDFSMGYVTRLESDAAYNESYFAILDERFEREVADEDYLLNAHLAQSEAINAIDRDRLVTASKVASGTVDFANNMYTMLGQKGKAFAQVAKGMAITQAVIDGTAAAVSAWKAGMSTGGPWAPAIAAAYTVASLARTGALIASIGGSQGGGGGGTGGEGTVRTAPGGGFNAEYPVPSASSETKAPLDVTFNVQALDPSTINWDKLMEESIAPALERLSGQGQRGTELNITVVRR